MRTLVGASVLVLLTLLLAPSAGAQQQEAIVGHWEGAYGRLGAMQTVMLDFRMEAGQLKATYDLPELSIFGEPVAELDYKFPQLVMKPKYGKFTMQIFPDIEEMTGDNKAWNPVVTLHLKRRPPEPLVVYPQEEVRFKNGAVTLAGTLVKPLAKAPYPALVVVHGSGAQGRADSFYRFWGNFFAQHGVAALIYDKRGVGGSTGNYQEATFDDLAGDALAAVELLGKRRDIKHQQIGLFGISQGGWIAPLAASRSRSVSFLMLDVGPAVTVAEQELNRVEYSMREAEFSEPEIANALAYTKAVFRAAYTGEGKAELDALTQRARSSKWAEQVQLVESQKDLDDWRRIRYDPASVLRRTKIPILSIFGEKDVLVPPQENRAKMESYLKEAGNQDVKISVIPNAGHDMINFQTLRGGEWKWPEHFWVWQKKSSLFYETIVDWLQEHAIVAAK